MGTSRIWVRSKGHDIDDMAYRVYRVDEYACHSITGVGAFYRGFIANFCRIGSWNVIMFLMLEQLEACTARLSG
ncbi:hypothetical protein ACP4OV_010312 [Aristida adscensionis]